MTNFDNLGEHRHNCFCWKCKCRRNVDKVEYHGNTVRIILKEPIRAGEMVCFSYLEPLHLARNAELRAELAAQDPGRGEPYAVWFPFRSQQAEQQAQDA